MSIKIECANCKLEKEMPENISLKRLNEEAEQFFHKHKTRVGKTYCHKDNLFIRTFKIAEVMLKNNH